MAPERQKTAMLSLLSRPKLWNKLAPRMSLKKWQKLNSSGLQSVEAESAEVKISQDLVLTLDVRDIQRDFFGDPLPEQGPLVGPFQRLAAGKIMLPLWPPARP